MSQRRSADGRAQRRLSGAEIVVEHLAARGVRHVAGIPGHGSWYLSDALLDRQELRRLGAGSPA